jgi:hypothetical protein
MAELRDQVTNVVSRTFGAKQWDRVGRDLDRWIDGVRQTQELVKKGGLK